jgi:hypothetical protein
MFVFPIPIPSHHKMDYSVLVALHGRGENRFHTISFITRCAPPTSAKANSSDTRSNYNSNPSCTKFSDQKTSLHLEIIFKILLNCPSLKSELL